MMDVIDQMKAALERLVAAGGRDCSVTCRIDNYGGITQVTYGAYSSNAQESYLRGKTMDEAEQYIEGKLAPNAAVIEWHKMMKIK